MANIADVKSLAEFITANKGEVPVPRAQALPVPPLSYGNVKMANAVVAGTKLGMSEVPITGALMAEGVYSEPSQGQIWPRIG